MEFRTESDSYLKQIDGKIFCNTAIEMTLRLQSQQCIR